MLRMDRIKAQESSTKLQGTLYVVKRYLPFWRCAGTQNAFFRIRYCLCMYDYSHNSLWFPRKDPIHLFFGNSPEHSEVPASQYRLNNYSWTKWLQKKHKEWGVRIRCASIRALYRFGNLQDPNSIRKIYRNEAGYNGPPPKFNIDQGFPSLFLRVMVSWTGHTMNVTRTRYF